MACIEARGLRKVFGTTVALDNVDLRVEEGRILGLIASGSEAISAARVGASRAASMNTSMTASYAAASAWPSGGLSNMKPAAS